MSDVDRLGRPEIADIITYSPGKTAEIKLASNENPLGPSPQALAAMEEAIRQTRLYPDPTCAELRAALAEDLGVPAEWIVVGRGSDEVIHMTALAFLSPGEEVIFAVPPFALYPLSAMLMGCRQVTVPMRDYRHDLEAMADAIAPRTKMVFIANPYNPTSTIVRADEVERFMARVPDHVIVVFDQAYHEYVSDPGFPQTLQYVRDRRNVIVLHTFSKIYALAGLRVGYGIARPEIVKWLLKVQEPFNVSNVAQAAALGSLRDKEQQVRNGAQLNRECLAYLCGEFDRLGLTYAEPHANFVFVDTRMDSVELFGKLRAHGFAVRTGDIFGTPTHIRVSTGTMEQCRAFIARLEAVLTEAGVLTGSA